LPAPSFTEEPKRASCVNFIYHKVVTYYMSNGDKIPLEKAKRGSEARKRFTAVKQKYGDPETLELEALKEIKTAYKDFTDEMSKLKLQLTGPSQSEMKGYMDKVDTCYTKKTALQRRAETEKIIEAEVIDETEEKPEDHTDYQTIAPETDEPAYQPPQAPETAAAAPSREDLITQAREKYKHFDEGIEHLSKWLEDARARDEEYKAKSEKERTENAASNTESKATWDAITKGFDEASKRWDAADKQQS